MKFLFLFFLCISAAQAQMPKNALQYKNFLIKEARFVYGMESPNALFAGLIHAESTWNPDARSHAGAQGLAQFMPGTRGDMEKWYTELRPFEPYNPKTSIRAMLRYLNRIHKNLFNTYNDCEHWAFTLTGYNAGPGNANRSKRRCRNDKFCDDRFWFDNAIKYAVSIESRQYAAKVVDFQKIYKDWGYTLICECRINR